jgi:hypothetical protein
MRHAVDRALGRYQERLGDRRTYLEDPQNHWQWKWIRRMLDITDMAMEDEGVDEHSRERVIRTILYGAPDPLEAEQRIQRQQEMVERLKTAPVGPIIVPTDPGPAGWYPPGTPPEPSSRSLRDRLRGNDRPIRAVPGGPAMTRQGGKRTAQKAAVQAAVDRGEHVHVVGPRHERCVSGECNESTSTPDPYRTGR